MSQNYRNKASDDAADFCENFIGQIVEQIVENGKASDDYNNDYTDGNSYFHESYVDRSYDLEEAAALLDDLDDHEETDSGLWEGQSPRDAISTQAAFTYGNAVASYIHDLIKGINGAVEELQSDLEPDDALTSEQVEKVVKEQIAKFKE